MSSESNQSVYTAMVANVVVAVAKFVAAAATGSTSMVAEGIHSLIDTSNGGLLLWGRRAGARAPDETHPFGYGKEQYFWTLIVALTSFTLGGSFSIFEGVQRLLDPEPLEHPWWNYSVLFVAAVSDGYSLVVARRQLRATQPDGNILRALHASKDPSTFAVVFEDLAALLGVAVAFLGVFLSHWLESSYPDAIASILIGLILMGVAVMLAYESKLLLVGESADVEAVRSIHELVESDSAVARSGRPFTMHLGPNEVLLNLDVQFQDRLSTDEIIDAVDRLEQTIRKKHPDVKRIFIEAERLRGHDGEPARARGEHGRERP